MIRAQGYITFFMLNSAEHEILTAPKYENIKKLRMKISRNSVFFLTMISLECYFFGLINVKMPINIGILTFMSRNNLSCLSAELSMKFFL